jgi:hypothetical protein
MNDASRPVFYVSDGTGITAETIGHSVLTQFSGVQFVTQRIPFVDTAEKAEQAAERIRRAHTATGLRPVVVNTVIDGELAAIIGGSGGLMLDVFAPFIDPLQKELGVPRQPRVGQAHGLVDMVEYEARINATNFALTHDDGVDLDYNEAEVILVGVSRSGKTPTSTARTCRRSCARTGASCSASPSIPCACSRCARRASRTAATPPSSSAASRCRWPSACSVRKAFPCSAPPIPRSRKSPAS